MYLIIQHISFKLKYFSTTLSCSHNSHEVGTNLWKMHGFQTPKSYLILIHNKLQLLF